MWGGGKRRAGSRTAIGACGGCGYGSHGFRQQGAYRYPLEEAAKIAVATVNEFIEDHPGELDLVEWVLFDQKTYEAYDTKLSQLIVSRIVHSPRLDEINRALMDGLI